MGATTTWVNNVTEGQTFFETEETDVQPLSDVMIYRWQTNDPRLAFQLDTFGADWYIGSFLGMYDDGNNYYSLLGITMSNFEIELGGVAGAGFVITPLIIQPLAPDSSVPHISKIRFRAEVRLPQLVSNCRWPTSSLGNLGH